MPLYRMKDVDFDFRAAQVPTQIQHPDQALLKLLGDRDDRWCFQPSGCLLIRDPNTQDEFLARPGSWIVQDADYYLIIVAGDRFHKMFTRIDDATV